MLDSGSRLHRHAPVYASVDEPSLAHLQVAYLHRLLVRREEVLAAELHARNGRFVNMLQLEERLVVSDVEELHDAVRTAHGQLHAIIAETEITRFRVEYLHTLQAVARARIVTLDLAVDVAHREHLVHRGDDHLVQLGAVSLNRCHEGALLQVQTVDLVAAAHGEQLTAFLVCESTRKKPIPCGR